MKIVLQRVAHAKVTVYEEQIGAIKKGFLLLLGVSDTDTEAIAGKMVDKICKLRIFPDENGKTNLSLKDVGGEILVVSQFTLYADCKKGNRPSFIMAAPAGQANALYGEYVAGLRRILGAERVVTGVFQAAMLVEIVNDGPVTIELKSRSEL